MLTHQVFYTTNPKNTNAVSEIIRLSKLYLSNIPQVLAFNVGVPVNSHRAVMEESVQYDVAMTFNFKSPKTERKYQADERHLRYVKTVLKGWMLEGSQAIDPEQEFIDYILGPKQEHARNWVRNPDIPEDQVLWAGEQVIQFITPGHP